ncbi:UNVERIFIED_CONTAM: hypothetical protein FKN15_002623, partial [Acipenser sinensis]
PSCRFQTHSLQDMRQQAAIASKVFVQRDYSTGTTCQFQMKFLPELENRIDRQQFEETVRTLNNLYAEAEKIGGKSYLEGCLACLTAYTIFLCMETHYEKVRAPPCELAFLKKHLGVGGGRGSNLENWRCRRMER